jgi:hypothetical protein
MCNFYSVAKGQAAILAFTRALRDTTVPLRIVFAADDPAGGAVDPAEARKQAGAGFKQIIAAAGHRS